MKPSASLWLDICTRADVSTTTRLITPTCQLGRPNKCAVIFLICCIYCPRWKCRYPQFFPRILETTVFVASRILHPRSDREIWRWDQGGGNCLRQEASISTSPVPLFLHLSRPFSLRCARQMITLRVHCVYLSSVDTREKFWQRSRKTMAKGDDPAAAATVLQSSRCKIIVK